MRMSDCPDEIRLSSAAGSSENPEHRPPCTDSSMCHVAHSTFGFVPAQSLTHHDKSRHFATYFGFAPPFPRATWAFGVCFSFLPRRCRTMPRVAGGLVRRDPQSAPAPLGEQARRLHREACPDTSPH